jgi:hypothetical protein
MRTTVEITDEQHLALTALAQRRGHRGLSSIVQEALDSYLESVSAAEIDLLLGLEGVLSEQEAEELRKRVDEVRETWRAA